MRIHKLMMPAVTLAGALALAGCGGGGGTATTGSQTCAADETGTFPNCVTAEQTAATKAIEDANAAVEALGDSPTGTAVVAAAGMVREAQLRIDALPAADQAAEDAKLADSIATINTIAATLDIPPQFTTAGTLQDLTDEIDGLEDLAAGADEDGSALKTATDAYKKSRDADALKGVSADAKKYAEAVIKAKTDLEKAVMDTEAAKMAAETAKKGLEKTDSQYGLLDAAVERADEAIEAAKALLAAGGGVAVLAAQYDGTDDDQPSPDKWASEIGDQIMGALTARVTTASAELPTGDAAKDVFANDSTRTDAMMTFAQLFAGATTPQAWSGNTIVNAISLKGEPAADGTNTLTAIDEDGAPSNPTAYEYRGISGMAACRKSSGCELSGANLGDGWYFYPLDTGEDDYYVAKVSVDDEGEITTTYEPARFAEWGMWLTTTTGGVSTVGLHYSTTGYGIANQGVTEAIPTEVSAKYSGTAQGLSARKTGTGDDATTASGHFLADVSLNATFGSTANRLTGDIDNFRTADPAQGTAHVNSDWELDLQSDAGDFDGGISNTEGTFGPGAGGNWFASAYGGSSTERPTGVIGAFDASFTTGTGTADGEAAGVFHAKKPE